MNCPLISSDAIIAVIGAGSMGAGIVQLALQAGHTVKLFDTTPAIAKKAYSNIVQEFDRALVRQRLDKTKRDAMLARFSVVDRLSDLAAAELVIEAIIECAQTKQDLFAQLETVVSDTTVFASNTSSLSITTLGQKLKHTRRLIGWHFFNPATRMPLVEIICGVDTDPGLIPTMQSLSQAWGKTAVLAPNTPGFIVNRVARPYYAEALRLQAENIADILTIDKLARETGRFAMGPFELMDLIGHDTNLAVTESVFAATAYDHRYAPHVLQQELVRAQRYGRKSGIGFYDYRQPLSDDQPVATQCGASSTRSLSSSSAPPLHPSIATSSPKLGNQTALSRIPTTTSSTTSSTPLSTTLLAPPTTEQNPIHKKNKQDRPSPNTISVAVEMGKLTPFVIRLQQAGIKTRIDPTLSAQTLDLNGTRLRLTDGRTAAQVAADTDTPSILLDYAYDFATTPCIAVSASPVAQQSLTQLVQLLQPTEIDLVILNDIAGLVVMRLLVCVINEAADLLTWTRTNLTDIDTAMRLGTAYPLGPLAWADVLGIKNSVQYLANLHAHYGESRYRCAPKLNELATLNRTFYE